MPSDRVLSDSERELPLLLEDLRAQAPCVDRKTAMMRPRWVISTVFVASEPRVDFATYAIMGEYVLYISRMTDAALANEPHMSKFIWSLMSNPPDPTQSVYLTGGFARDVERAKRCARFAFQASYGVVPSPELLRKTLAAALH